jgi:drug/metabolite transporter (DMT)-like permease
VGLALLLAVVGFVPGDLPSPRDLMWGGIAGLGGGIGVALLYKALAVGTMAVVAPTTAVCAVMIPVMAEALGGVRLAPAVIAGIALALVAIVLVGQHGESVSHARNAQRSGPLPPGMLLALMSGVAIGLFFLALARTSADTGLWPLVAARTVSVITFVSMAAASSVSLRLPAPMGMVAAFGGALDMAANALYLLATRFGPLSIAVTLCSLYPASTVLLARVVLGERLNRRQALGIVCALVAIVLIVSG